MYTYRKTPAEKAAETRLLKLCDAIHSSLVILANRRATEADVVALFRSCTAKPGAKGDAFMKLDDSPRRWGEDQHWHGLLRRTRNHPVHGPELFATFRSGE